MYKLLLVTDKPQVRTVFDSVEDWDKQGFRPPHVRTCAAEAEDCLLKHHADGIFLSVPAEDERQLMLLLDRRYPLTPVVEAPDQRDDLLRNLNELRWLLNRVRADYSNDRYDEAEMLRLVRHAYFRRVLQGQEKDPVRRKELEEMAAMMKRVPWGPATNFHDACETAWAVCFFLFVEGAGPSITWGRFDQYMYPYYKQGIEDGTLTPEKAMELIEEMYIKVTSNVWFQSTQMAYIFGGYYRYPHLDVGGLDENGRDASNELSYICLRAMRYSRTTAPSVSLMLHQKTPESLLREACELLVEARSSRDDHRMLACLGADRLRDLLDLLGELARGGDDEGERPIAGTLCCDRRAVGRARAATAATPPSALGLRLLGRCIAFGCCALSGGLLGSGCLLCFRRLVHDACDSL